MPFYLPDLLKRSSQWSLFFHIDPGYKVFKTNTDNFPNNITAENAFFYQSGHSEFVILVFPPMPGICKIISHITETDWQRYESLPDGPRNPSPLIFTASSISRAISLALSIYAFLRIIAIDSIKRYHNTILIIPRQRQVRRMLSGSKIAEQLPAQYRQQLLVQQTLHIPGPVSGSRQADVRASYRRSSTDVLSP